MSYDRFVHAAVPVPGLKTTLKTWPGALAVLALYPENVTIAWLGFVGSTVTDDTARLGRVGSAASIRVNVTAAGFAAFAVVQASTRPAPGAPPTGPGPC